MPLQLSVTDFLVVTKLAVPFPPLIVVRLASHMKSSPNINLRYCLPCLSGLILAGNRFRGSNLGAAGRVILVSRHLDSNYLCKEKEIVDIQLELCKNAHPKTQMGHLTCDLEDTRATLSDVSLSCFNRFGQCLISLYLSL